MAATKKTIYETLKDSDGDYSICVRLLHLTGLNKTLDDRAVNVTFFAPNDTAFKRTVKALGFDDTASTATEDATYRSLVQILTKQVGNAGLIRLVTDILKYHISPPGKKSGEILKLTNISTSLGIDIRRFTDLPLALGDLAPTIADPVLIPSKLDISAVNGIIHGCNRVLLSFDPEVKSTVASSAIANSTANATSNDGSACFPLSAVVHTAEGSTISMRQLQAGHSIRVSARPAVPASPVYLFSHRVTSGLFPFTRISTEGGHTITLSASHYLRVPAGETDRLVAAGAVTKGDVLLTLDGPSRVRLVEQVEDYGLVAPHTLHGDLVVNRVVASSYTRAVHPRVAHAVLAPVRALVRAGVATEPLGSWLYHGHDALEAIAPAGPAVY